MLSDYSIRHATTDKGRQDAVSKQRRAWFIGLGTIVSVGVPCLLAVLGYESPLAVKVVDGLLGYAELLAMLYLTAGVIDHSDVLRRIGGKWDRMDERSAERRRDGFMPPGYGGEPGFSPGADFSSGPHFYRHPDPAAVTAPTKQE